MDVAAAIDCAYWWEAGTSQPNPTHPHSTPSSRAQQLFFAVVCVGLCSSRHGEHCSCGNICSSGETGSKHQKWGASGARNDSVFEISCVSINTLLRYTTFYLFSSSSSSVYFSLFHF